MTAAGPWLSAVLATYALSRLWWRVPLPVSAKLWPVHGLSLLMVEAAVLAARGPAVASLVAVAIAQGGWLLLDRARGVTGPASAARAEHS